MLAALLDNRASKSFFQENPNPGHEGVLTMSGVVLAIMSTILGGGMMAIPHATLTVGLIPTIGVALFASAQVVVSCVLFLRAREVCPGAPQ